MAVWADVEALGYACPVSAAGMRYVAGFGIQTYVREDDQAQIDSLADPVLHARRIAPPPEPTLTAAGPTPLEAVTALDPKTATVADVIAVLKGCL